MQHITMKIPRERIKTLLQRNDNPMDKEKLEPGKHDSDLKEFRENVTIPRWPPRFLTTPQKRMQRKRLNRKQNGRHDSKLISKRALTRIVRVRF